jgi:hypothetical protein
VRQQNQGFAEVPEKSADHHSPNTHHGMKQIAPKFEDWPALKGRTLLIRKGSDEHEGVLKGIGQAIVAVDAETVSQCWLLSAADYDLEFHPQGWKIFDITDGR